MEDAADRVTGTMSVMRTHGTLTAVPLPGLMSHLSSDSLVSFHRARPFSISDAAAVRRLHFTWLRRVFASLAWTAPRRSSRYVEEGCRIRNGSSAICGLWPLVCDLVGYWPGIASFISGTKTSKRCFAYLPRTPRQRLF